MGIFSDRIEREKLEQILSNMDKFCGSLEEYNDLKGQEYIIIDTKKPEKYVYLVSLDRKENRELIKKIINQGCEGFIRYAPPFEVDNGHSLFTQNNYGGGYGIPVKSAAKEFDLTV